MAFYLAFCLLPSALFPPSTLPSAFCHVPPSAPFWPSTSPSAFRRDVLSKFVGLPLAFWSPPAQGSAHASAKRLKMLPAAAQRAALPTASPSVAKETLPPPWCRLRPLWRLGIPPEGGLTSQGGLTPKEEPSGRLISEPLLRSWAAKPLIQGLGLPATAPPPPPSGRSHPQNGPQYGPQPTGPPPPPPPTRPSTLCSKEPSITVFSQPASVRARGGPGG